MKVKEVNRRINIIIKEIDLMKSYLENKISRSIVDVKKDGRLVVSSRGVSYFKSRPDITKRVLDTEVELYNKLLDKIDELENLEVDVEKEDEEVLEVDNGVEEI